MTTVAKGAIGASLAKQLTCLICLPSFVHQFNTPSVLAVSTSLLDVKDADTGISRVAARNTTFDASTSASPGCAEIVKRIKLASILFIHSLASHAEGAPRNDSVPNHRAA
jgi:hypothetical protein